MPRRRPTPSQAVRTASQTMGAVYGTADRALSALYASWATNPRVLRAITTAARSQSTSAASLDAALNALMRVSPEAVKVFGNIGADAAQSFVRLNGLDVNVNARLWAEQYATQRITTLRDTSIRTVRQYTLSTIRKSDGGIPGLAKRLRNVVYMDPWTVEQGAKRRAKLIERGWSPSRVNREVAAYERRIARSKAQTIARTEVMATQNHAYYQSVFAARAAGLLDPEDELLWIAHPECCESLCAPYAGTKALIDEGFATVTGVAYPPMHPNCRCTIGVA